LWPVIRHGFRAQSGSDPMNHERLMYAVGVGWIILLGLAYLALSWKLGITWF
jgi:hypothetical protein